MINVKLNSKTGDDEFERMRLFCALRHFPELRTSLAVAGQVNIPEPQSKQKSAYVKPKPNDNFKLGFSNRNAHKVLKNLSTSVLAEVPDRYGPVRSGMRQRREEYRNSQMSHKDTYNALSRPTSANNNTHRDVSPSSPVRRRDTSEDIEDPLRRVSFKISRAGISLGHRDILNASEVSNEELKRELKSSGLLPVLGLPPVLSSAPTTPRFSPRNNNHDIHHTSSAVNNQTMRNTSLNRGSSPRLMRDNSYNTLEEDDGLDYYVALLKKRLEVILCIRVDPDELSVLYEVLYG